MSGDEEKSRLLLSLPSLLHSLTHSMSHSPYVSGQAVLDQVLILISTAGRSGWEGEEGCRKRVCVCVWLTKQGAKV